MAGLEIMGMRRTQCLELVSFYLAVLVALATVVAIAGSGVLGALAQTVDAEDRLHVNNPSDQNPDDGPAITDDSHDVAVDVSVQNWRGFAIKDDESHPIRLNVETIRPVDPAEARRLLSSNISLEEMRSQTRAGDRDVIRRGNLRLDNDIYRLINITAESSGNRSILNANVAGPVAGPRSRSAQGSAAPVVGHAVVTISVVGDTEVAEGTLAIEDFEYSGPYRLSLNQSPGRGPRAGMAGR